MKLNQKHGCDHSKLITTLFTVLLNHFIYVMQQFHHNLVWSVFSLHTLCAWRTIMARVIPFISL